MKTSTAVSASTTERDPNELLDRARIEREYGISIAAQIKWFNENKYGWRDITIRVGVRHRVRRRDLEHWLESRKGLVAA